MTTNELDQKLAKMQPALKALREAEASLRSVLESIASERRDAERAFSRAESEISIMTASRITVGAYDMESRIRNAIHAANSAGSNLNGACMRLVDRLDTKCSMLLQDGIDPALLEAIAKEFHQLNETSIVDLDFSGSFEGVSFGHVGTIRYEPTRDALRIEARWELLADEAKKKGGIRILLPQYGISESDWDTEEKYRLAVKDFTQATTSRQLKKVKPVFVSLGNYKDAGDYVKKCEEMLPKLEKKEAQEQAEAKKREAKLKADEKAFWESYKKSDAAIRKIFVDVIRKDLQSITQSLHAARNKKEKEEAAARKRIAQAQEERAALGFFKFKEKKALAQEIASLQQKISTAEEALLLEEEKNKEKIRYTENMIDMLIGKPGDEVTLGTQFYALSQQEVVTPMKWLIVEQEGTTVKLLAKHTVAAKRPFELDKKEYKNGYWLSQIFLPLVFVEEELSALTSVSRDKGDRKVFLPTEEEVKMLGSAIQTTPEQAILDVNPPGFVSAYYSSYWLSGFDYNSMFIRDVKYVSSNGSIEVSRGNSFVPRGVRPMIAVDVHALREAMNKE